MSISTVHSIGPYEVPSLIGAGGMGEVYKAHDPRLNRTVAIKILSGSFVQDEKRLRRFEQEAHALAALNHPNIVAVYDFGWHEGNPYLVTEFLEGETLRERLDHGPIPARKAVSYAVGIAEALSAAHAKGIIHRDLKPANIFLTTSGTVKVLDFGLARSSGVPFQSRNETPTLAITPPTEPGTVMGTVGYMSPEQVRGEPVDHRSDIFSFGTVLYEMITGKRAFQRGSSVETMNAILKEEPAEILTERSDVPPAVDRVLRHCLEKESDKRFDSARDLAFDLESLSSLSDSHSRQSASKSRLNWRRLALLAAAVTAILVAAFTAGTYLRRPNELRFRKLTFQRGYVYAARFAPDRKTVLYSASWVGNPSQLYSTVPGTNESRSLDIPNAQLLAASSKGELAVLLHPFLDQAGFLHVGILARVSLSGGTTPREIAENVDAADWSPDGSTLAVLRLDLKNNTDILEYPPGKELFHSTRPDWLSHVRVSPDGKLIALLQHSGQNDDRGRLLVFDIAGKLKLKTDVWAGVAGLAWRSSQKLWLAATPPQEVVRQLFEVDLEGRQRMVVDVPGEVTLQDVSEDGAALITMNERRIFLQSVTDGKWRDYTWLDRSIFDTVSRDGSKILFHEGGQGGGPLGIVYLVDRDGSPPVRLSEGYGIDLSSDQKWALVWLPYIPPQFRLVPTGVGEPKLIKVPDIPQAFPFAIARDGSGLLWAGVTDKKEPQVFKSDLDGSHVRPVAAPNVVSFAVSPNGRYGLYRNAGVFEVWDHVENLHKRVAAPREGVTLRGNRPARLVVANDNGGAILGLSDDGQWVYVSLAIPGLSRTVSRMNVNTGALEPLAEVPVYDPAGMLSLVRMGITPDEKTIVVNYVRHLSELYLMHSSTR